MGGHKSNFDRIHYAWHRVWIHEEETGEYQQVAMTPGKFLWPWEILDLDIPELDQEPQA